MSSLKGRKYIVIQAGQGRAIILMEKEWYEEVIEEQILEDYSVIGQNVAKVRKGIAELTV
jgi:hypothetical protein